MDVRSPAGQGGGAAALSDTVPLPGYAGGPAAAESVKVAVNGGGGGGGASAPHNRRVNLGVEAEDSAHDVFDATFLVERSVGADGALLPQGSPLHFDAAPRTFTFVQLLAKTQEAALHASSGRAQTGGAVQKRNSKAVVKDIAMLKQAASVSAASGRYQVLVRRGCILVSFPCMSALVTRSRAWLIKDGLDSEKELLRRLFDSDSSGSDRDTFEFVVLTGLLALMHRSFKAEVDALKPAAQRGMGVEEEDSDQLNASFQKLSEHLKRVKKLLTDLEAALTCVETLHDSAEDTAHLVLSLDPAVVEEKESWDAEKQEMEDLLEWSVAILQGHRDEAQNLMSNAEQEQEKIKVGIDNAGNKAVAFQIKIQLVTMGLGFCSMISGCACGGGLARPGGTAARQPPSSPVFFRSHAPPPTHPPHPTRAPLPAPVFGMNLSNGWCGPEGCAVLGTVDAGRFGFGIVIVSTLLLAMLSVFLFQHLYMGKGSKRPGSAAFSVLFYLFIAACALAILISKNVQALASFGSSSLFINAGGTP